MTLPALTPWQKRTYQKGAEIFASGRMGHALLITGVALSGKRIVAEHLAQRLLCASDDKNDPSCGVCRGCRLFVARAQKEPVETRPDGSMSHPFGYPMHPDVYFIGYGLNKKTHKPRHEIGIEQIRKLSEKLGMTSQYKGVQCALIDPANGMSNSAANALLKTLEEPGIGRYLWLISANPEKLPATIRSRCQTLKVDLPPHDEALAWLHHQGCAHADEVLHIARGHPVLAMRWADDGSLTVRREVINDLDMLWHSATSPAAMARRWTADEHLAMRLYSAAERALQITSETIDLRLTCKLGLWFDKVNRARALLETTVRIDLVIVELLLVWQRMVPVAGHGYGK